MIKITIAEKKEKKGIRESLIKSYEILEEKLSQNNEIIKELEAEINGEDIKKRKGKVEPFGLQTGSKNNTFPSF